MPREGEVVGKYRLVRLVGRGGMGSVYEARQLDLDRAVALKVLSSELAEQPQFRDRFSREAAALAALDSPHVIQVYDYGTWEDTVFIATQFVRGPNLSELVALHPELPIASRLALVRQIADGLADAHDSGVLHRDLKPSNVLVRTASGGYFAYLCDFGIAWRPEAGRTRTRGLMGTPGYMAPELHNGAQASTSSDIYSLGCLLWAILAGHAPYEGDSDVQVALAHMQQPVPTLEGSGPTVDAINEILARAMAKAPQHRYSSATELAIALQAAQQTIPLAATTAQAGLATPAEPTVVRSAPVSPAVPPVPAAYAVPQQSVAPGGGRRGLRRMRTALVAGIAIACASGGLAYAVTHSQTSDRGQQSAQGKLTHARTTPSSARQRTRTSRPAAHRTPASASPSATPDVSEPSPSTSTSGETPTTSVAPSPTVVPSVTCWNGLKVASAASCSTPTGREGMASVFPSFDSSCISAPLRVPGKVEVYECHYGSYLIRYSRWNTTADRKAYYAEANPGAVIRPWYAGGELAGTQYGSYEDSPTELQPYQWSATYNNAPFSVSVEGVTPAARKAGTVRLDSVRPERIGLLNQ